MSVAALLFLLVAGGAIVVSQRLQKPIPSYANRPTDLTDGSLSETETISISEIGLEMTLPKSWETTWSETFDAESAENRRVKVPGLISEHTLASAGDRVQIGVAVFQDAAALKKALKAEADDYIDTDLKVAGLPARASIMREFHSYEYVEKTYSQSYVVESQKHAYAIAVSARQKTVATPISGDLALIRNAITTMRLPE